MNRLHTQTKKKERCQETYFSNVHFITQLLGKTCQQDFKGGVTFSKIQQKSLLHQISFW